MSLTEKETYRLVPYRFIINESSADICKLEKLTNLFPDMKALIELELFKMNNLQHMMDRLSRVYTPSSAIDTRDDTLHLFLGPYHISLGPATYGALQFRNISTALLSHSKSSRTDNTNQQQKRRHDAALRRFRRSVRKLILIKSIIDQLRLASVLTPYNQYELYTHGIYDLVLAGHLHNDRSVFEDEKFAERIKEFRSMNNGEKNNSLLASKFIKIQTLLHLLTPAPQQNQTDNSATSKNGTETTGTDEKINENPTKPFIDPATICCSQHSQNTPLLMFPLQRSFSQQTTQFLSPESPARRNSHHHSRRHSSLPSKEKIRQSLPDLNIDNTNNTIETKKPIAIQSNNNQEDAFVNRISTLLTNYLLSQQSTTTTASNHNDRKLADSTESISSLNSVLESDDSDVFNQLPSTGEPKEFDKLLRRIKKVVDNNLSDHQNPTKSTAPMDLRQKLLISRTMPHQDTSEDELDVEHPKSDINRRQFLVSSKSQSFDDANLRLFSTIPESNDWVEF